MAGQAVARQDIDTTMLTTALMIRDAIDRIERLGYWNATMTEVALQAEPYGYTETEAYAIKAFLDRLAIARTWLCGGALPTEVHDSRPDLAFFTGLAVGP
jgi:hypothetical protein